MYRAKETFWAPGNRHIIKGDLIAPHDSVVKGREGLFEEVVIPRALQPSEASGEPGTKQPGPEQADGGKTGGDGDEPDPSEPATADSGSTPAAAAASAAPAAAKKTTAKKTTTAAAARKPAAGGDAK